VSSERGARGAWSCASCGAANDADAASCRECERVRTEEAGGVEPVVCPACKATNEGTATACTVCGWPFPAERRVAVPGLYMGRDAALHDAAERDAREVPVGNAWVLWMSIQIVCAVLFVVVMAGVIFLRIRPPGGIALAILGVILFVGAHALWQFVGFLRRRRR
jgi:ribosomal protein L40E